MGLAVIRRASCDNAKWALEMTLSGSAAGRGAAAAGASETPMWCTEGSTSATAYLLARGRYRVRHLTGVSSALHSICDPMCVLEPHHTLSDGCPAQVYSPQMLMHSATTAETLPPPQPAQHRPA